MISHSQHKVTALLVVTRCRRTVLNMFRPLLASAMAVLFLVASPAQAADLVEGREYERNPLRISVSDESVVRLTDSQGKTIPFAADTDDTDGVVHLPGLIAGKYKFIDGEQVTTFSVKSDVFVGEVASPAYIYNPTTPPSSSLPTGALYGAIAAATLLSVVLLRRRPLFIVGVALVASTLTFGVHSTDRTTAPPAVIACAAITDLGTAQGCALERLHYLLAAGDVDGALEEFVQTKDMTRCHEVAHAFGRSAWVAGGSTTVAVPGFGFCDQGFYHGALEAAAVFLNDQSFADVAKSFCSQVYAGADEPVLINCSHGIGHGLMLRYAGDIDQGKQVCASLEGATAPMRDECTGALYMEQSRMMLAAEGDKDYQPATNTPTKELCKSLELNIAVHCYNAVAMGEPMVEGSSLRNLIEFCNGEPATPGGLRLTCLDGVTREAHNHEGRDPGAGAVCKLVSDPVEQQTCLSRIGQRLVRFGTVEDMVEACIAAGVKNTDACNVTADSFWLPFVPGFVQEDHPLLPPAVSPFAPRRST
jgi:hypothetical protein